MTDDDLRRLRHDLRRQCAERIRAAAAELRALVDAAAGA